MKNLEYYTNLEYRLIIEHLNFEQDTYFNCYSEELGKYSCFGQGETVEEAVKNFYIEKNSFIESLYANSLNIPEPEVPQEGLLSGIFNLRTDPVTHTMLALQAKKHNLSLNQYVNKLIDRNVTLETFVEKIIPRFDVMQDLIIKHDCNVKQQFMNFWLNNGLKKLASSLNNDWLAFDESEQYDKAA